MVFASRFDQDAFHAGPPALFTVDPRGQLRIDPERTREAYLALPDISGRDEGIWLMTDRATGVQMVLVSNQSALVHAQDRSTGVRYPDYASALAETVKQWAVAAAEGPQGPATHES